MQHGGLPDLFAAMKPVIGALLFEHENAWAEPLNGPLWYLPALFLTEIAFLLLRWIFRWLIRRSLPRELLLLAITLAAGVAAIYYKRPGKFSGTAMVCLRSVVMLFFMQLGVLYRRHLEKHDTLKSPW